MTDASKTSLSPPGDPEEFAATGIQWGSDEFAAKKSPFNVEGVKNAITREEIVEAIHEGRGNDRW